MINHAPVALLIDYNITAFLRNMDQSFPMPLKNTKLLLFEDVKAPQQWFADYLVQRKNFVHWRSHSNKRDSHRSFGNKYARFANGVSRFIMEWKAKLSINQATAAKCKKTKSEMGVLFH